MCFSFFGNIRQRISINNRSIIVERGGLGSSRTVEPWSSSSIIVENFFTSYRNALKWINIALYSGLPTQIKLVVHREYK
jgi:hypothetical protein